VVSDFTAGLPIKQEAVFPQKVWKSLGMKPGVCAKNREARLTPFPTRKSLQLERKKGVSTAV
jgi:hypothetical protein